MKENLSNNPVSKDSIIHEGKDLPSDKRAVSLFDAVISGEITSVLSNEPAYVGLEVRKWLLERQVFDVGAYSNLSKRLRSMLTETYPAVMPLKVVKSIQSSKDRTEKFLFQTGDQHLIEAVLIDNDANEYGRTHREGRYTLCLSSQVGCPLRCDFCATGMMKFARNLTAGEIVSQYLLLLGERQAKIERIVFMGMGEPFLNRHAVWEAVRIFTNPLEQKSRGSRGTDNQTARGLGLGASRISISTSGVIVGIHRLAEFERDVRLSLSLHSAIQSTRNLIMPDFKHVSLDALRQALVAYSNQKYSSILIEYIMIKNLNDSDEHARALVHYVRGLRVKVNLIAYNHVRGKPYEASEPERIYNFMRVLKRARIFAIQRYKKGDDIAAACGQLSIATKPTQLAMTTTPGSSTRTSSRSAS